MEIKELLYQADVARREESFEAAIQIYQKINDILTTDKAAAYKYASISYRKLCYCYRKQGKINMAIETGQQSINSALKTCLKYNQNKDSRSSLAYCCMNLGVVYDENGQFEEAIEYYRKGADIFREYIDDDISMMNAYINAVLSIGTSLYFSEEYAESQKTFQYMVDCIGISAEDSRYHYAMKYLKMIDQRTGVN